MKPLLFILLFLIQINGISQGLYGTAISYYISDKEAIIAADTKINFTKPHKDSSHIKIHHKNNLTWVYAGFSTIEGEYDVDKIINSIASKKKNYRETIKEISFTLVNTFAKCDYFNRDNPVRERVLQRNGGIITLLFVSFVNGKVQYDILEFKLEKKGNKEQFNSYIIENQEMLDDSPSRRIIGNLGKYAHDNSKYEGDISTLIYKKVKSNKFPTVQIKGFTTFKVDSYDKLLYYLVYRTSIKYPSEVGRPITVYKITNNSFQQLINK